MSERATLEPAPEPVRQYGKYYLVRKLAEGGMAEIFLAKQLGEQGFERNLVIKRMLRHLSDLPDFVSMFLDEARLAARLSHANTVQISDLGHAEGCYYICMEYLAGEDLSTVLRTAQRRRELIPLQCVVRIFYQAAEALAYAHDFVDETGRALRIVHRDVSPSNIFLTYQGGVKLLDFGIAKAETQVTKTSAGIVKGKYLYMAPEQARSAPVDLRADIYSLGACLYEALTNVRPFAREHDFAILNAVLTADYKPPRQLRPDLPPELEAIVLKAMAPRAENRYQHCNELAADLEAFEAASTSGAGGSRLAAYLKSLMGEDRVKNRSRVPSLAQLASGGVDVPGFTNPFTPKTNPDAPLNLLNPKTESVTTVAPGPTALTVVGGAPELVARTVPGVPDPASSAPPDAPAPAPAAPAPVRAGRPPWPLIAGMGAFFVVVGGLVAWLLIPRPAAVSPLPVAPAAPAVVQPTPPPAEPAAVAPPAPAPAPAAAPPVARRPLAELTVPEIRRIVSRHSANISDCFERFSSELPSDEGQLVVQFTVLESGKVVKATVDGPLAGTRVADCLSSRVAKIPFPAHRGKEISLGLPFTFHVQK